MTRPRDRIDIIKRASLGRQAARLQRDLGALARRVAHEDPASLDPLEAALAVLARLADLTSPTSGSSPGSQRLVLRPAPAPD